MKKISDYSLTWKLLLVPVVASLSFAVYLAYSSMVLSDGSFLLKDIRDADFPILEAAGKNLNKYEDVVTALNTAAATGEVEFLDVAKDKASEILGSYEALEKLDSTHKNQIEKLKSGFNAYFARAIDIARRLATKTDTPSLQQIAEMRTARDAYLSDSVAYRDIAENEFHETVGQALKKSNRARTWGVLIGTLMLLVIVALTLLVTRGILALEKIVEERNKMLVEVNSRLKHEIEMLKAAEEARSHAETSSQIKSEFLANMSHEIRTPMNAIIGLSHLCMQTDMSRKQHDYLQKIHGAAKSLLGILNDILDVSKIEAGKMEIEQTAFDLEKVMGNLATILGDKSHEKNLEFLLETDPVIPLLLVGDPLRLGQVLINLAGNAVKFTEAGEVLVRVELEKEAEEQVDLRFTVKDTGIGMSQTEIDKLFCPFTQADTSITRKFGGTGLGLTISKRLVEMMGGKIWVESAPGKGSRFIFTMSFKKAAEQHTERRILPNIDLRGLRVLAADDNETSRHILESYLGYFSLNVTMAASGLEALHATEQADREGRPYQLVILDWKMPEMDGIETAAKIHEIAGLSKMPKILLISSFSQSDMLKHTGSNAVDGVLSKPFQQSELFNAAMEIFGSNEAKGKGRTATALFHPDIIAKVNGARILLVEDNEINQQVARELLEKAGVTVVIAENGKKAITSLWMEKFDGVLMDMQMPVMDGITATREIRKNPRLAELPIIAMTANVMSGDRDKCMAAGMNDHINKPIDPNQMLATIAKWIIPAQPAAPDLVAPQGPEAELDQEALSDLPEVSVDKALHRMGGSVAVYCTILKKFCDGQQYILAEIRSATAANNWEKAELLAHTLRGLLGTVGADKLSGRVAELEASVRDRASTQIESLLTAIEPKLMQLFDAINRVLQLQTAKKEMGTKTADTTEPIDLKELANLVRQAILQLKQFDSDVEDTVARICRMVSNDVGMKEKMASIERHISSYNYTEGLIELSACAKNMGVS